MLLTDGAAGSKVTPMDSQAPCGSQPGEATSFLLRSYRRPLHPTGVLPAGMCAGLAGLWVFGALRVWLQAPRGLALMGGIVAGVGLLLLWLRRWHAAHPAGHLVVGAEGICLEQGRKTVSLPLAELSHVEGTRRALVFCGGGRRLAIEWPRFEPLPPRQVVQAVVRCLAAQPEGARILSRTAAEARPAAAMRRIVVWVLLANAVLWLLGTVGQHLAGR
ncbi:MAG: hypothetical protein NZ890_18615 [Myxococcota bacterium]|nr:hypothetical protein [Myxococcota bacterium]